MKSITRSRCSVAMFLLVFQLSDALAHHSRAEFSPETLKLEGELVSARWVNPHPVFSVNATDDAGVEELWQFQGFGTMYSLRRVGVSGDDFTPGERIKIAGLLSAWQDRIFLANNMLLENGNEVVLNGGAGPYWNEKHIGGREHWAATEQDLVDAAAEGRGLYRVWSHPYRNEVTNDLDDSAISMHLPYVYAET